MFKEIKPKIFVLNSGNDGSNIYFINDKKKTLIDSSLAKNFDLIKKALAELNLNPEDIDLVLHTHGHADHIGCSAFFEKAKKAMHPFDASFVNEKKDDFSYAYFFNQKSYPKIDKFLSDTEIIDCSTLKLKVIFTPGHTKGSICFLEPKNKILFSGDTLFCGAYGRTDLNSSNEEEMKSSLEKLSNIDFELLLPGHGKFLEGKKGQKSNLRNLLSLF
ncbi:MAG: MBL fold metallo-hydrolase [Candidatus Diapherotrites archaeon CG08_land_8_20_14_0_20_34_12]|nr:MAG: MBL fold metallo-hydrolase [Candidatus Diapherotrites archaeon CG08_land_8_20_14_0_20_34_12]